MSLGALDDVILAGVDIQWHQANYEGDNTDVEQLREMADAIQGEQIYICGSCS